MTIYGVHITLKRIPYNIHNTTYKVQFQDCTLVSVVVSTGFPANMVFNFVSDIVIRNNYTLEVRM